MDSENISKVEAEQPKTEVKEGVKLKSFKLFHNDIYKGTYCGKTARHTANKAFNTIIKDMIKSGTHESILNVNINFSIRECTVCSRRWEYNYIGIRKQLEEPIKVKIKNEDGSVKEITCNYTNKITLISVYSSSNNLIFQLKN